MKLRRLASALAMSALMVSGASAASLTFNGPGTHTATIGQHDGHLLSSGASIRYIRGDWKTSSLGLQLDEAAKIKFTYLYSEADNTNYVASAGGEKFNTNTASMGDSFVVKLSGMLDFALGTSAPTERVSSIANNGGADPGDREAKDFGIAYIKFEGDDAYYVFFDDIAQSDRDFDDLVMKVELAPIPLPAAGFLLLGGIGALGAVARRRKKN